MARPRESFLDTLPGIRQTLTPADRVAQFEALVRWQAVNAVRLDDLCRVLDERVRDVDATLDAIGRLWDLLTQAKLMPDRFELMEQAALERLGQRRDNVVALRVAE